MPLFLAEALLARVSRPQQNDSAGVCGILPVPAQLSSTDGVRAGRDDFVCGAGPSHCEQGQKGGFCPVSRPFQAATKPDKLSDSRKLWRVTVDMRQHCTDGSFRFCRWRTHTEALSEDTGPEALSTQGQYFALHVFCAILKHITGELSANCCRTITMTRYRNSSLWRSTGGRRVCQSIWRDTM